MRLIEYFLGRRIPLLSSGNLATLGSVPLPDAAEETPVEPCRGSFDEWTSSLFGKFAPIVRSGGVKKAIVYVDKLSIVDLRALPSRRTRIVGSSNWVTDAGRAEYGGTQYLLVREPMNPADPSAVAVVGKGRKLGYLSASKASAFADVFDPLPVRYDSYLVDGASVMENSIRLWVDVPNLPALRAFVAEHARSADRA